MDETALYSAFEKEILLAYSDFTGDKSKRSTLPIIDMLKLMELKLEELISDIKLFNFAISFIICTHLQTIVH